RASIFRCHLLTSFVGIRLSWPGLSPASTNPIPADSLLLLVVPQQTAVDKERGSRNVVGFLGSQETGQTCNIFRFPEPPKRDILKQLFELHRIIQEFCVDRC